MADNSVKIRKMIFRRVSLNLGYSRINCRKKWRGIDIRYPVKSSLKGSGPQKYQQWQTGTEGNSVVVESSEPHYVPKDSEVVTKLLNVYRDVTGEKDAQPFTIGGGTYAKALGKSFVAFGPEFPGAEASNIHDVDEHVLVKSFMDHCVICTMAMYELAR